MACHAKLDQIEQRDALLAITQNDKKLFQWVMTTIPTLPGWCTTEKACVLAALVLATKPDNIVEIGVFGGRSLFPMAAAMRANNRGTAIGIDPYSSQESAKHEIGENRTWWEALDHQSIKTQFLQTSEALGLKKWIHLIEKPSDNVKLDPISVHIVHSDGSHTEQAVRDAEHFGPVLPVGGLFVNDDIMWVGGGVLRAIDTLEEMGFAEAYRNSGENWNIMQRVK